MTATLSRRSFGAHILCMLFACATLFPSPATAQQEFASENKVWSFTMPPGWEMMSGAQIAKLKADYKAQMPSNPSRAVVGFIKSGAKLFPYPQVIVQVLDTNMVVMP